MHDLLDMVRGGISVKKVGSGFGELKKGGFVRIRDGKVVLSAKGDKFLKKYKTIKRFTDGFRL